MSHPDPQHLRAYLRGDVRPDVAAHIDACPACQAALAELPTVADDFQHNLRQAARQDEFTPDECREAVAAAGPPPGPVAPTGLTTLLPPPRRLGDCELLHPVGEPSGMGVVYKGRQLSVGGREVAIKVIRPDKVSPEMSDRFRREVVAAGRLEHPNIVRIYDAGDSDGELYLVMEFLEGLSLAQLVKRRGPLPVAEACELIRQAALGLDHAHTCGVLHRDVKPANLFLTTLGEVKLLDFGLARLIGPDAGAALTWSGQGMGTPAYMAPEQAVNAAAVDARADLYSLGLTLYHLLTAQPPACREPVRQRRPDVPDDLARLLDGLFATDPDQRRPATAARLAEDLRPFTAGREPEAALPAPAPGVAAAETLHAALDVLLWDEREGQYHSITEPGVLPLRTGSRFQVQVRLNRPAHVYLLWLTGEGAAQPLYPWQEERWDRYAPAPPVERLLLPRPEGKHGYQPWELTGPAGVETLVLLARPDALPEGFRADLPEELEDMPRLLAPEALPDRARGYWFTCREEECDAATRAVKRPAEPVRDPLFQVQSLLRDRLGARFRLIRAVSFVNLGSEGVTT
jgi:hypothetical protein